MRWHCAVRTLIAEVGARAICKAVYIARTARRHPSLRILLSAATRT
jgi:hypothetical protein